MNGSGNGAKRKKGDMNLNNPFKLIENKYVRLFAIMNVIMLAIVILSGILAVGLLFFEVIVEGPIEGESNEDRPLSPIYNGSCWCHLFTYPIFILLLLIFIISYVTDKISKKCREG